MTYRSWVALVVLVVSWLAVTATPARAWCTMSVSGVAFSTYDVYSAAPLDSTGQVMFGCEKQDKKIRITLSTGSSGTYAYRTMTQGSETLRYNLYINGFATVWGDGSGSTGYFWDNNPPNNKQVTLTIYGRIPAQQDVAAGPYSDTITAQLDF